MKSYIYVSALSNKHCKFNSSRKVFGIYYFILVKMKEIGIYYTTQGLMCLIIEFTYDLFRVYILNTYWNKSNIEFNQHII